MKIDWKYQRQQYGAALMAAVPVFVSLSLYIFYRRGYYDLYIANKAFAGDAAVLLGVVFLLGPLSRFFVIFLKYLAKIAKTGGQCRCQSVDRCQYPRELLLHRW